jgi:beta-mannosidase
VCNDSLEAVSGTLYTRVQPWQGVALQQREHPADVAANETKMVAALDRAAVDPVLVRDAVLVADLTDGRTHSRDWLFAGIPAEMAPPPTALTWSVDTTSHKVAVESSGYARVVTLDGPVVFSDNYFDMLPGERRIVEYRAPFVKFASEDDRISVSCWNAEA